VFINLSDLVEDPPRRKSVAVREPEFILKMLLLTLKGEESLRLSSIAEVFLEE
jgi:hypothetical protein